MKVQPQEGGEDGPWADGCRQRGGLAEGSPRAERRRHRGVPSVETCVGATYSPGESMVTTAGRAQKAVQAGRVEAETRVMLTGDSYS